MTQEELLKEFMSDSLILEKGYLTPEQIANLRWRDDNVIIVELFKLAIQQHKDGRSTIMISRSLNQKLN